MSESTIYPKSEAESDSHKMAFGNLDEDIQHGVLQVLKLGDDKIETDETIWRTSKLRHDCMVYQIDDLVIVDLLHGECIKWINMDNIA